MGTGQPRPAAPEELSKSARSLLALADAAGWWTVAVVGGRTVEVEVRRGRSKEEWIWTREVETSLLVRGLRDGGQFVAVWYATPGRTADVVSYWWTRDHQATVDARGRDEVVRWRTERPEPVRVAGLTDLRALVAPEVVTEHRRTDAWRAAMTDAALAGVDPAQMARWCDERSDLAAVRKSTADALASTGRP